MRVRSGELTLLSALLFGALVTAPARAQKHADTAWSAPLEFARRRSPVLATTDAIKRGRELFVFACAQCLGNAGHGDGLQASALKKHPADLCSPLVQSKTDGMLFWMISTGRGEMPKATLDDAKIWAVVAYIRTLGEKARR
jgi:mono/diheme cytochrome c family protein